MEYDLRSIATHFNLSGEFIGAAPLGSGLINDTFALAVEVAGEPRRYVLQRINHQVFSDPPAMMNNIRRVTEHIHRKLSDEGSALAERQLTVFRTHTGETFHRDSEDNYWRVYNRIENAATYDTLDSPSIAREAARMFGWFQRMLIDLPGGPLHETIKDYHNTPKRLKVFEEAVRNDTVNRAAKCRQEISFVEEHVNICHCLLDMAESGKIPVRTTHNDTKINNVLIDNAHHTGVCVIDLDTVMPGLSLYDFGDMVRTATTRADEDEKDLSKVTMHLEMFEALVHGFAKEAHTFFTPAEKQHLPLAGKLMAFEQLIRFLGDYLAGDVYYRVQRPKQNLDRARTQMKLIESINEQEEAMFSATASIFEQFS